VNALLDTGSPISFIKEKIIPSCFVNYADVSNKLCGINGSKLNIIGSTTIDINCDKINEIGVHVYVTDNTMSFSMIIGQDLLKQFNVQQMNPEVKKAKMSTKF